jgi:hypothetical protein
MGTRNLSLNYLKLGTTWARVSLLEEVEIL